METVQRRVLLVDDFEEWRRMVCSILREDSRFNMISEAVDGMEALENARQLQPDLILLDVGLPKLGGIQVAQQLANISPRSKVLFVSQNHDPDIVERALNTGARGYILKSDGLDDLVQAINLVLAGGVFVSHSLLRILPSSRISPEPKPTNLT